MSTTAPRVLAASITIIAVIIISTPAPGADCSRSASASNTSNLAGCTQPKVTLRAASIASEELNDLAWLELPLTIDFDEAALTKKLEEAGLASAQPSASLAPPKPSVGATGIGTWSKLETERLGENSSTRSGVGVNYKPSRTATVGMAVESEENKVDATLTEQTKLAATLGLKPSPLINFEASAKWANQSTSHLVTWGAPNAQSELSASLNGDWLLGAFKFAPSVTVAHATEVGLPDAANASKGTIVVAPTISRPVALDHAQALEPFLTYKQELDISAPAPHTGLAVKADAVRSAGGGIKLEERGTYSLSVTTDIENLDAERHSLRSEFRLNVPLK